jgi:hypothetical protein
MPNFKISTKTHALPLLGKRTRHGAVDDTIFTITLSDDVRLRYSPPILTLRFRPMWNSDGVGATLLVMQEGKIWECARYVEQVEIKHLGEKWFETQDPEFLCKPPGEHTLDELRTHCLRHNEEQGGYKPVPLDAGWRSDFGAHSFWAYFTTRAAATIQDVQLLGFEPKDDGRATLELYAVVHLAQDVLYARMPESEQHFSMRMELVLVE